MKKSLLTMAVCALVLGAHSYGKTFDVMGRQNNKAHYAKTVEKTTGNSQNIMVNHNKALSAYKAPLDEGTPDVYGWFINDRSNSYQKTYGIRTYTFPSEYEYFQAVHTLESHDAARVKYEGTNYSENLVDKTKRYTYNAYIGSCYGKETCAVNGTTYAKYMTIYDDSKLYSGAIRPGYRGKDVGIYVMDYAIPNPDYVSYIPFASCPQYLTSGSLAANVAHASNVVNILNWTAEKAKVFALDVNCGKAFARDDETKNYLLPPSRPDLANPAVYIGVHAYGTGSSGVYDEESRILDDYVYATRVIEVASAGNAGTEISEMSNISEVGRGVNVITVGAAQPKSLGNQYEKYSSWKNPRNRYTKTTYDKPEIVNYTNFLFPNAKNYVYTDYKNATKEQNPYFNGTSASAPYTAGMIADLLQHRPFYKWHPEVVKALLLTSSIQTLNNGETFDKDRRNSLIGKGAPLYTAMYKGNRSRYWNGDNDDHFKDEEISFQEKDIVKGKKYRIAISWLNSGTYVYYNGKLQQNLDLYVSQNGASKREASADEYNPFEMVEFTAQNTNPINITIKRARNDGGRVLLGYNFYEVP